MRCSTQHVPALRVHAAPLWSAGLTRGPLYSIDAPPCGPETKRCACSASHAVNLSPHSSTAHEALMPSGSAAGVLQGVWAGYMGHMGELVCVGLGC